MTAALPLTPAVKVKEPAVRVGADGALAVPYGRGDFTGAARVSLCACSRARCVTSEAGVGSKRAGRRGFVQRGHAAESGAGAARRDPARAATAAARADERGAVAARRAAAPAAGISAAAAAAAHALV